MNFEEQNPYSISNISAAVRLNLPDVVEQLIRRGKNVNIVDNRGWTPLHEAAVSNRKECLEILLKANSRINATTHKGETPLFLACERKCVENVSILLNWKANLKISNNESITPLHVACTGGSVDIVTLLLKKKARVNAEDYCGFTPLHEAVMIKNLEICKMLIESGANLNSREYDDGHLPLHFACSSGNIEVLRLLLDSHKEEMKTVVNLTNSDGFTPLMLAVQVQNIEIIQELLNRGANPNLKTKEDTIALHLAIHTGNLQILKLIYNVTSRDIIEKYCIFDSFYKTYTSDQISINSLTCLAIDSESLDCLKFIMNSGVSSSVLNCPVVIKDQRLTFSRNETALMVYDPVSFLLKEKMGNLQENTVEYLKVLLEGGISFIKEKWIRNSECFILDTTTPMKAATDCIESASGLIERLRGTYVECFCLLLEHGVCQNHLRKSFMDICRLGITELLPILLQHSNTVDIETIFNCYQYERFVLRICHYRSEEELVILFSKMSKFSLIKELKDKKVMNEIMCNEVLKSKYDFMITSFRDLSSLKRICRFEIRRYLHAVCTDLSYKFRIKLNSLPLPISLLSFLRYEEL